jgi:sulfate permease, SulP family
VSTARSVRYFDDLRDRIRTDSLPFVVLRLKRVRHPDAVCIERLEHFVREQNGHGVTILLAGVRPDILAVLQNVGFTAWFPAEQLFPEEDEEYSATSKAVRYAYTQLDATTADGRTASATAPSDPPVYYLV